ncbi:uncharacterized protein LOC119666092 [Teleopsis dalmanni]|uniref:uncharacterized protein LOC119666092 n=1 Tax=Teleopsis dalmanni TaxID=139649 RepID=UPI0018CF779B|nr:uncharacterized protein LOC119666092 [Teleopsis dalmanni]
MLVTRSDDESGFRPLQSNNSTGHISQQEQLHPTERHHSIREVSRIAVKIPSFWHARPELWFAQIESQFVTSGVTTEHTKFHSVVASIDGVILAQVSDLVLNMPTENPYSTLKKRLLEEFSISEQKRLKKLLQDMDLGDLRPSQLLREMKNLAGTQVDDSLLRSMWMTHLPANMRAIISVSSEPLDKIAIMADRIAEANDACSIQEVRLPTTSTVSDVSLHQQILQLSKEVAELRAELRRSRSRATSRHRSRRNSVDRDDEGLC